MTHCSRIIFALCILSCMLSANTYSQTAQRVKPDLSDYRKTDLGISLGLTFPRTDISGHANIGLGFDLTRFLSPNFALQLRYIHASLSGTDDDRPDYQYFSGLNDVTLNFKLQTTELIIFRDDLQKRIAFYFTIGAGFVNYFPEISADGGHVKLHGIYSQYTQEYDTFDFRNSTDFVLPLAIGTAFRINDRISLNAEYSYRITNTDKLDGYFKLLSSNDTWSYFNAGIIIHLGKQKKVLEWENPREKLYNEIDSLQKKISNYNRDSDNDGVADAFDKEPATPAGTRVYGDGTSVDTDGDGVPDRSDDEPFSAKNAKVDARGVTIRQQPVQVTTPPAVVPEAVTPKKDLPVIYFDYDKSVIKREYNAAMGEIAQVILTDKTSRYQLLAICDNPSKSYNLRLSNRRAEAVKNHLVKYYNISPARLIIDVGSVPNEPGKAEQNRRVEIKRMEK
jgi:outer membrane protein OmpA-like peptidoglycan-associated protein